MSDRIIIGIAGYTHSGKSTLSDIFVQNNGFRRASFADKIREIMMVLGVEREVLLDPVLKERPHPALLGKTPREAMETVGTAWGRNMVHPELWIHQFKLATANRLLVICDDVRYQNEVDTIASLGGQTYRLRVQGRQPRVKTDFAVDSLTGVEDLKNDIDALEGPRTKIDYLYGYIY